jgi:putative transposase
VFVEKLTKSNMVKNHHLARSILDSGWGIFVKMLDYKTMLIEVPAKNTTVDCSRCGNKVPKSLAVRIHSCNVCGLVLDRDYNASINILRKGLKIFGIILDWDSTQTTAGTAGSYACRDVKDVNEAGNVIPDFIWP